MPALIVDPELLAAVTRQFQLRGELQPFNLTENVVPIFDIGRLIGITQIQKVTTPDSLTAVRVGANTDEHLVSGQQASEDAEWINDASVNPSASDVLADTGQLAAGVHIIQGGFSHTVAAILDIALQWRNAANDGTLATIQMFAENGHIERFGPFFVNIATDERIRFLNGANVTGTVATNLQFALTDPSVA